MLEVTRREMKRLAVAAVKASRRDDVMLDDLRRARTRSLLSEREFAEAPLPAFRHALSVGFRTPPHGDYVVRVVGFGKAARAADLARRLAKEMTRIASFPLAVKAEALAVSGIVGAGGMPTIVFPS
jgi:hypothetical protein